MKNKVKKDEWMTNFYGCNWYKIENPLDSIKIHGPCLIECIIDANEYENLGKIQQLGFTLVETAIEFETIINSHRETLPNLRIAKDNDLEDILKITEECYQKHEKFYNRFRNESYFSSELSKKYFMNSVISNYAGDDIINIVAEDGIGICAYYIIKKIDQLEPYGKYKGIISGVSKRSRGNNLHIEMQNKITEIIGEPYITVNRTQLGNYRVINNHLIENKQLSKIEHYFYLKKQ